MDKPIAKRPPGRPADPDATRNGAAVRLAPSLWELVDGARGTLTRAEFIRRAIKDKLDALKPS